MNSRPPAAARMLRALHRAFLTALVWANNKAKCLAIRLVYWTGKAPTHVHPKHLLADEHWWYLPYCGPADAVLDLGCGHGTHARRVARRVDMVVGIDRDVRACRADRAPHRPGIVAFYRRDLEAPLDFRDAAFSLVLCLDVLEHVVRRDQLLGEIRRILRPDGTLLLVVPNRTTSWKRRLARAGCFAYSDRDHKIEYTLSELAEELRRNGFTITRLHPSVVDTPLIGCIDLVGGFSLPAYCWLTDWRRRRAERHPEDAAGFHAVCKVIR